MLFRTDGVLRWLMAYSVNTGLIMMWVFRFTRRTHYTHSDKTNRIVSISIAITVSRDISLVVFIETLSRSTNLDYAIVLTCPRQSCFRWVGYYCQQT